MRTIHKDSEPPTLTAHRKQAHADYDNYNDHDTLRRYLVEEQHGLCCYCQSRIRPETACMKVEHWMCQANFPEQQLEYKNLLGACMGGEGSCKAMQHCDTHKGNNELCFCLIDLNQPIEKRIKFLGNGTITSENTDIDYCLNNTLNLNCRKLVTNRKAVLDAFKNRMSRGNFNPSRELPKWDGSSPGNLPEYAQVVVYWLEKKIARGGRS